MATYSFTLRAGITLADASFQYGGGDYDIKTALTSGSGTISTTDDELAARLRTVRAPDGGLLLDEGGVVGGPAPDRHAAVPAYVQGAEPVTRPYLWEQTSGGVPTGVRQYGAPDGSSSLLLTPSGFDTINMGKLGAVPGVDCTALLATAIADARNANGIKLKFPAGLGFTFSLVVGAVAAAAGVSIIIEGEGKYATTFSPSSPTSPLLDDSNWGDTAGNECVFRDCGIFVPTDRAYSNPVIKTTLVRFPRYQNMRVDCNNKTCTVFQFDGAYQFTHSGLDFVHGKYAVPWEIVSNTNLQNGSTPPQMDTMTIEDTTMEGCCGIIVRDAAVELHNLRLPNFKVVATNYYPINSATGSAQVVTTLAASAVAGASAISVNAIRNVAAITNVAVTSNVATITCTATFGSAPFAPGTTVTITGLTHTALNGTFTVTGVTNTGFTFAVVTGDIASVADTGTATGSGTGTQALAANDAIAIDMAGKLQMNKISSVTGSGPYTINLAQPLLFDVASGRPVVQGGVGLAFGDAQHSIDAYVHVEGLIVGVDLGNTHTACIAGYSGAAYFVRCCGNVISCRVGPTEMSGVAFRNQVFMRPTYAYGTSDANWHLIGPFGQGGSSYSQTVQATPTNESGTTSGSRSWKSSTSVSQAQETWNHASGNGVSRTIIMNAGQIVQTEKWSGQGQFTDGIATRYSSGAGAVSISDANFASSPPPNGTLAVHYDTTAGKTYLSVRANGVWKVVAGPI